MNSWWMSPCLLHRASPSVFPCNSFCSSDRKVRWNNYRLWVERTWTRTVLCRDELRPVRVPWGLSFLVYQVGVRIPPKGVVEDHGITLAQNLLHNGCSAPASVLIPFSRFLFPWGRVRVAGFQSLIICLMTTVKCGGPVGLAAQWCPSGLLQAASDTEASQQHELGLWNQLLGLDRAPVMDQLSNSY